MTRKMATSLNFIIIWVSILLSQLCFTPSCAQNGLYSTKLFTQILDHFNYNPQSYETFQQRYLVNDTYWGGASKNAPIFVYMGGEADIEWIVRNAGFVFEAAPRFKALLVFIEHRYYGKSIPFGGNMEVAYSNSSTLGYLSSTQALADYATLIIDLKNNLSATDSPVVVFGGSYGGMLAAWFRMKYPHVAIGALASSAPILQFLDLVSPYTFNNIVTQDFKSESENCYQVLKGAWKEIKDTTKNPGQLELLQESLGLCKSNMISANAVITWLQLALRRVAMTDNPIPSNFLIPLPAYPVKKICEAIDKLSSANEPLFTKLHAVANIYYNYTGTTECFNLKDIFNHLVFPGWNWQACTEMIMAVGGNNEDSIFPAYTWKIEDQISLCNLSQHIQPRPHWITTEFGGHDIESVLRKSGSNIIFYNGLRDPWSGGGVLKDISKTIVAIVAKEGAHHVDLMFSTEEDPKWLTDIRIQERDIIESWISHGVLLSTPTNLIMTTCVLTVISLWISFK